MFRPLVTGEELQQLERLEIARGLPSLVLMEVAARAVADVVEARFDPQRHGSIVALAGPGNNGADAVAAARLLADRGLPCEAWLVGDPASSSGDLAHQVRLHGAARPARASELVPRLAADVLVIDGLFGTGLVRPLDGDFATLAAELATTRPRRTVVAVDIPSGVHAGTGQILGQAARADVTVTFQVPKLGHYLHPGRALRGELVVADIGLAPRLFADARATLAGDELIEAALPPRVATAHKGTYGHLMVVAGQPERPGSALLAARAALRTGAGLVTVASDRETIARLAPALEELMGLDVGHPRIDAARVLAALGRKTALLVGPSLDSGDDVELRALMYAAPLPLVVDAGALHTVAADPSAIRARTAPTLLTPHPGEAAALLGASVAQLEHERPAAARALAKDLGAFVILKGASTVVAAPDGRLAVVPTGNPGMATAGTGDVLAGVLGGLLAQGVEPWLAARAAPYLHGLAGDAARDAMGEASVVASDLVRALGPTISAVAARARSVPWARSTWPTTTRGAPRGAAP